MDSVSKTAKAVLQYETIEKETCRIIDCEGKTYQGPTFIIPGFQVLALPTPEIFQLRERRGKSFEIIHVEPFKIRFLITRGVVER